MQTDGRSHLRAQIETALGAVAPVPRSKDDARANYDRLSRCYEGVAGRFERPYRDAGMNRLDLQPGEHVLDIGFGSGECVVEMARSVGETGRVDGIDISSGMFRVASERVLQADPQNARCQVARA